MYLSLFSFKNLDISSWRAIKVLETRLSASSKVLNVDAAGIFGSKSIALAGVSPSRLVFEVCLLQVFFPYVDG